jgi:hypothetical protein
MPTPTPDEDFPIRPVPATAVVFEAQTDLPVVAAVSVLAISMSAAANTLAATHKTKAVKIAIFFIKVSF